MDRVYRTSYTELFEKWLRGLKDPSARARIIKRIRRAEAGNLGDIKALGGGLNEMRIDYGGGYRLYWTRQGKRLIILLAGGDKSTQERDIEQAHKLLEKIKEERDHER